MERGQVITFSICNLVIFKSFASNSDLLFIWHLFCGLVAFSRERKEDEKI